MGWRRGGGSPDPGEPSRRTADTSTARSSACRAEGARVRGGRKWAARWAKGPLGALVVMAGG